MPDPRQQLLQLLRAACSCSYCKGWGRVYRAEVPPKWGYDGFPIPALGICFEGPSAECPFCLGSGEILPSCDFCGSIHGCRLEDLGQAPLRFRLILGEGNAEPRRFCKQCADSRGIPWDSLLSYEL